ncbi:hypothetical protein RJ640_005984 [Escallonia rubra]|uniref:RBR-type E3 ubiquitin transferase n=1 Tax=Escallonia rubra TaxID=112253 RepID=A0AA88R5R2_9ASTE|nr:hypothetical protein RJ640_005984 [Escallonia rubra]
MLLHEIRCLLVQEALTLACKLFVILFSKMSIGREVVEPSQILCEICLEDRESWQLLTNETCSHSFCYECISKHIIAKIEDNNLEFVACPGVNCNTVLDYPNACRLMIPEDILDRWDEFLCRSLIPESQKLYCPFQDCSAVLVNDSKMAIKEANCPECRRRFCARCRVPWHSEFKCREFQKLNAKRRKSGREEVMVDRLAKKKRWRRCPRCKTFVEKIDGCLHITCRCKHDFCYKCGSKWSAYHGCGKSIKERISCMIHRIFS